MIRTLVDIRFGFSNIVSQFIEYAPNLVENDFYGDRANPPKEAFSRRKFTIGFFCDEFLAQKKLNSRFFVDKYISIWQI